MNDGEENLGDPYWTRIVRFYLYISASYFLIPKGTPKIISETLDAIGRLWTLIIKHNF
jgi:hypothetical protein